MEKLHGEESGEEQTKNAVEENLANTYLNKVVTNEIEMDVEIHTGQLGGDTMLSCLLEENFWG